MYQLELDEFGAHQKIIKWVGNNQTVLEIGCASGYVSKELTKRGCTVTGIEVNSGLAEKARRHCQAVIIGNVENPKIIEKLGIKRFEVIILADVLEHLKNPEWTLETLIKFLEKKGKMIVSVPNIAFLTNRLLLFLGRFDYTDWGIMDKTHLRFFTKKSILRLAKNSGLKVKQFDYIANFTQLPLYMQTLYPILGKRRWWRRLEYKINGLWPEGLAVQFLLFCQKDKNRR